MWFGVLILSAVLIQKKATDVSPALKGTSIFLVGKHQLLNQKSFIGVL